MDDHDTGDCTCGNPEHCRCEELDEERDEQAADSDAHDWRERELIK